MSAATNYTSPVNQLFQLDHPTAIEDWSTYRKLDITEEHIPELTRMAVDRDLFESEEEAEFVATIHAWRTLAELQPEAAIAPLIEILTQWSNETDWWALGLESEELPLVFGRIGVLALPALSQVLADPKQNRYARQDAIDAVKEIYLHHPETRADCIQVLTQQLENFAKNDPDLNGFLVTVLAADMQAVESAAVMEKAYQAGCVNEDFIGDWEEAQVYLGLKEPSEVSPRSRNIITDPWRYSPPEPFGFATGAGKIPKTKAKTKRKLQKQSRRKNRPKKK